MAQKKPYKVNQFSKKFDLVQSDVFMILNGTFLLFTTDDELYLDELDKIKDKSGCFHGFVEKKVIKRLFESNNTFNSGILIERIEFEEEEAVIYNTTALLSRDANFINSRLLTLVDAHIFESLPETIKVQDDEIPFNVFYQLVVNDVVVSGPALVGGAFESRDDAVYSIANSLKTTIEDVDSTFKRAID